MSTFDPVADSNLWRLNKYLGEQGYGIPETLGNDMADFKKENGIVPGFRVPTFPTPDTQEFQFRRFIEDVPIAPSFVPQVPQPQESIPEPKSIEPATKPADVPVLGGLASLFSPRDPTRAPVLGGIVKAISDTTKPTDTSITQQEVPGLLDALNKPDIVSAGETLLSAAGGGFTKAIGTGTGLLRDAPLLGGIYRAGWEAPVNVLNELTNQTAGGLLVGGELLGRGTGDILGMYGAKGLTGEGSRTQEYLKMLEDSSKKAAHGFEVAPTDYLAGAFEQASPFQQLFTSFVNPVNLIDIVPIGGLQQARRTAAATGKVVLPETTAFGRVLKPQVEWTGDNAPLVVRLLFDLPKTVRDEAGSVAMQPATKLGITESDWFAKLMPWKLSTDARAFEMLRRSEDNVDAIFTGKTYEDAKQFLDYAQQSGASGILGKELLDKYPKLVAKDAQRVNYLTKSFDTKKIGSEIDERIVLVNKLLDDESEIPKTLPAFWKRTIESLRANKSLDRTHVLDEVAKTDLRTRWGDHIARTIHSELGITSKGTLKKLVDYVRQWEGALYIGLNPGAWIRDAASQTTLLVQYGINPRTDYKKIQDAYEKLGWNPFKEMDVISKELIAKHEKSTAFGAPIPKIIADKLPWYKQLNETQPKIAYWNLFKKALDTNWRRGHWFKRMPKTLEDAIETIHPHLVNVIYGGIEAGISPKVILENINKRILFVQAFYDDPVFRQEVGQVLGANSPLNEDTIRAHLGDHSDGFNAAIQQGYARAAQGEDLNTAVLDELNKYADELEGHHAILREEEENLAPGLRETAQQQTKPSEPPEESPPATVAEPKPEPPSVPPAGGSTGIPIMITRDMEQQLRDLGYPDEAINKLTPQQAQDILREGKQLAGTAATLLDQFQVGERVRSLAHGKEGKILKILPPTRNTAERILVRFDDGNEGVAQGVSITRVKPEPVESAPAGTIARVADVGPEPPSVTPAPVETAVRATDEASTVVESEQSVTPQAIAPETTAATMSEPPVPKVEAVPQGAKEAWQMTRAEYQAREVERLIETGLPRDIAEIAVESDIHFGTSLETPATKHKFEVIDALGYGKLVPPEVLADYPDLVPQAAPTVQMPKVAAPPSGETVTVTAPGLSPAVAPKVEPPVAETRVATEVPSSKTQVATTVDEFPFATLDKTDPDLYHRMVEARTTEGKPRWNPEQIKTWNPETAERLYGEWQQQLAKERIKPRLPVTAKSRPTELPVQTPSAPVRPSAPTLEDVFHRAREIGIHSRATEEGGALLDSWIVNAINDAINTKQLNIKPFTKPIIGKGHKVLNRPELTAELRERAADALHALDVYAAMKTEEIEGAKRILEGTSRVTTVEPESGAKVAPTSEVPVVEKPQTSEARVQTLVSKIAQLFREGIVPKARKEFEFAAHQILGDFDPTNETHLHELYDSMEGAFNTVLRERLRGVDDLRERIRIADEMENSLIEARRTISKSKLQQFSTPSTISESAIHAADIKPGDVIHEPTAGTGNLVATADRFKPKRIWVNELDETRRNVLKAQGYDVTGQDVLTPEYVMDGKKIKPAEVDVVIENPPWGAYSKGIYGKPVPVSYVTRDGKRVTFMPNDWSQRFYTLIERQAVEGGRIVAVMPNNTTYTRSRTTNIVSPAGVEFRKYLDQTGYLRAIIEAPAGAYSKRATDVPALLVVVDKVRKPDNAVAPILAYGDNVPKDWDEYTALVKELGEGGTHARPQEAIDAAINATRPESGPDATGLVDPAAVRNRPTSKPADIGKPVERQATAPDVGTATRAATKTPEPETGIQPVGESESAGGTAVRPEQPIERVSGSTTGRGDTGRSGESATDTGKPTRERRDTNTKVVEGRPTAVRIRGQQYAPAKHSDSYYEALDAARQATSGAGGFTPYGARAPQINPHPTLVVEAKSLSGVPYPDLEDAYAPHPKLIETIQRRVLSNEGNLEPVWAAKQQANKHNTGILIADDVGMGKSRTAAAKVIDDIMEGKKRILVITAGEQNILNLKDSEFPGVWAGEADEAGAWTTDPRQLPFPAERIHINGKNFPKVKKKEEGLPVFDTPAVYFVDENNLVPFHEAIRNLQVDAVVVDEAHKFKNLDSSRGKAWAILHQDWLGRNIAPMYLSATPATDVADLQYLYGLRIWRPDGFQDWINVILGRESPEAVARKQDIRQSLETVVNAMQEEVDRIGASYVEQSVARRYGNRENQMGYEVVPGELFVNQTEAKDYSITHIPTGLSITTMPHERGAIIVADMLRDKMNWREVPARPSYEQSRQIQEVIANAKEQFNQRYPIDISRSEAATIGITDATDVIAAADRTNFFSKHMSGFSYTLPPAHTEQIMRELKVGGYYMSRDISRVGVEFDIKEVTIPPVKRALYKKRIDLYRDITRAFNDFGRMNEGPSRMAAMFGVSGDIQADAKRFLFDARLPGIIDEIDAALKRGEKVVISVVSVSEQGEDTGNLPSAIKKINTQKVEKIGDGEYSDAEDIPEALIRIAEIKEKLAQFLVLESPVDVLLRKYGDRLGVITGNKSVKQRQQAQQAFQRGDLDVILISKAGKTGINLHDVTGDRRIHLIVGDYEWSATDFKQEMGRVDRTGQRSSPYITIIHSGSAGEKKFVSTIANRMRGLGATSKGAAETATGATEIFELGTMVDKAALTRAWEQMDSGDKSQFLDNYFFDKYDDGSIEPKRTIDPTDESLRRFTKALQSVEPDAANRIFDDYMRIRDELSQTDIVAQDQALRTGRETGTVIRRTQLGTNLWLTEAKNVEGKHIGILEGVLTPHMNRLATKIADAQPDNRQWMHWTRFHDTVGSKFVSGLRFGPSETRRILSEFGKTVRERTPTTALEDLHAGDHLPLYGAGGSEWSLYLGKAGNREGRIVIDGAKISQREALLKNGAKFIAAGNFFEVPEEKLQSFLERFPLRNTVENVGNATSVDLPPERFGGLHLSAESEYPDDLAYLAAESRKQWQARRQMDDTPAEMGHNIPDAADENAANARKLIPIIHDFVMKHAQDKPIVLPPQLAQDLVNYLQHDVFPASSDAFQAANTVGRWGIERTTLNYDARTNLDEWLTYVFPFLYWRRAHAWNWTQRFLERPQLLQAYVKAQQALEDATNGDEYPARLRGKLRLPLPFMEPWMGGSIYFDPLESFMPLKSIYGAELQRAQYTDAGKAIFGLPADDDDIARILRKRAQRGELNRAEIEQAISTKSGDLWEQAKNEASFDVASPDNLTGLFTPHAPLQWLMAALTENTDSIGPLLPQSRPIRNITGALGLNQGQGINIESPVRNLLRAVGLSELPEFDPWEEYRVLRTLANMTADGVIDEKTAKLAMIEKSGKWWQEASRRANAEKSGNVPSGLIGMLTPVQTFPLGEQKLRQLKAQKDGLRLSEIKRLGGNPDNMTYEEEETFLKSRGAYEKGQPLSTFYEQHPELGARTAVFQQPEERLRKWMIDALWTRYNDLSDLDKRLIRAQMGNDFNDYFVNRDTRNYDKVDLIDLIRWGQRMEAIIPNVPKREFEVMDAARLLRPEELTLATSEQVQAYQAFQDKLDTVFDRDEINTLSRQYKQLTDKEDKRDFLRRNPQLSAWWKAQDAFYTTNPDIQKLLEKTGAVEPQTTQTRDPKDVAFENVLKSVGWDYDTYNTAKEKYYALSKEQRSAYLKQNPTLLRLFQAGRAIYGDDSKMTSSSTKPAKVYDPTDYIRPVTPKKLYHNYGESLPRWGTSDMYKVFSYARRQWYQRQQGQTQGGLPYKPSPRVG